MAASPSTTVHTERAITGRRTICARTVDEIATYWERSLRDDNGARDASCVTGSGVMAESHRSIVIGCWWQDDDMQMHHVGLMISDNPEAFPDNQGGLCVFSVDSDSGPSWNVVRGEH